MEDKKIIYPAPLKPGDKIAIVSPAGNIKSDLVYEAADVLRREGYQVEIMPHALGKWGHYSGTHNGSLLILIPGARITSFPRPRASSPRTYPD